MNETRFYGDRGGPWPPPVKVYDQGNTGASTAFAWTRVMEFARREVREREPEPPLRGTVTGGQPPARNATCACGSGRKFKKCCLVNPPDDTTGQPT